jgi:hypothetical protein
MKSSAIAVASLVFSLTTTLITGVALGGPYADEMAKCLVQSTTDSDKTDLVKWMFSAVALHPAVKSLSAVSDAESQRLNKIAAKLVERLLTESCKSSTQDAIKYEGPATFQSSFNVLGQAAAHSLFSDPSVAKGAAEIGNHFDKQKFERVFGPMK